MLIKVKMSIKIPSDKILEHSGIAAGKCILFIYNFIQQTYNYVGSLILP